MKKINTFIMLLVSVLECAEQEKKALCNGKKSKWSYNQIQNVILPEVNELLLYANKGRVFFKYGQKQRMLESTYLITDSLDNLSHTDLGEKVLELQRFFNSL